MDQLIGKQFEQATIFEPGFTIGYRQSEIMHLSFLTAVDGWRKEHFSAQFVFRGKRKKQLEAVPGWVIIRGWDHPKLEWGIEERTPEGKLLVIKAKFPFGSDEWDVLLDDYLRSLGSDLEIIFDGRVKSVAEQQHASTSPVSTEQNKEGHGGNVENTNLYPDEVGVSLGLREGALQEVYVNKYERNPEARQQCLNHHGYICQCCQVDMQAVYGQLARNYIHVHHKIPLADIGQDYEVDPIKDLAPICPNCHAMLHRPETVLTVEQLRLIIERNRSRSSMTLGSSK